MVAKKITKIRPKASAKETEKKPPAKRKPGRPRKKAEDKPKKPPAKKPPAKKKKPTETAIVRPDVALDRLAEDIPMRKGGVSLEERGKEIQKALADASVDWTDIDVWEVFAAVLYATAGNVKKTCWQLGIHPNSYYAALARYPEFHNLVAITKERAVDMLESEAIRRATEGVRKGVYHKGERVDEEVVYSDKLLIEILKARSKDYKTKVTEHQGPGGGPIQAAVQILLPDNGRDAEVVEARVVKDNDND
jgi:hypothetical protein